MRSFVEAILAHGAQQVCSGPLTASKVASAVNALNQQAEDAYASAVAKHLRRSVLQFAEKLENAEWHPLTQNPAEQSVQLTQQLIDLAEWKDDLDRTTMPTLGGVFVSGVVAEMELHNQAVKRVKTTAQDIAAELNLELPPGFSIGQMPEWLLAASREAVAASFGQDYWLRIPETTRNDIQRILETAIRDGLSVEDVAQQIRGMVDGSGMTYDLRRARMVARTEGTDMLNAGHVRGIQQIEEETGVPMTKEWVSVLGSTTRASHAIMDGTVVLADGMFDLEGVEVPHPGHFSLPARNRIHCQCTVISGFVMGNLEE